MAGSDRIFRSFAGSYRDPVLFSASPCTASATPAMMADAEEDPQKSW